MSDDELEKIREKKMQELKERSMQQQELNNQQQQQFEQQKKAILMRILSSDARVRLQNLKMVRKEFAEAISMQLIQLYSQGRLQQNFDLPMSDGQFKALLKRVQKNRKRNSKIRIL